LPEELDNRISEHVSSDAGRLESWKEIAAYLRRDMRTVQRWEKREGLPVHRHLHDKLGTVYAFKAELDAWWRERGVGVAESRPEETQTSSEPAEVPARPSRALRFLPWLAAALLLAIVSSSWFAFQNRASRRPSNPFLERATQIEGTIGRVSPDGRWLAYLDGEQSRLLLKDLLSGDSRVLYGGHARMPMAWAPDSSGVALLVQHATEAGQFEIRTVNLDDGEGRVWWQGIAANLVEPQDWVDAHRIVGRVRGRTESEIVLLQEGSPRATVLATVPGEIGAVGVSPTGQWVAYSYSQRGNRDVYVRRLQAPSKEIRVTDSPAQDGFPAWSPDGRYLIFVRQRGSTAGLWAARISPTTGERLEEVFLRTMPGSRNRLNAITRNGHIYFSQRVRNSRVFLLDIDAKSGIPQSQAKSAFDDDTYDPVWIRPGRLSYRKILPDNSSVFALRNVEAGSQNEYHLPRSHTVTFLAHSNGGKQFTFFGLDGAGRRGFFEYSPETDRVQTLHLTEDDVRPPARWSPDGNELLFSAAPLSDGRHPVQIFRRNGSGETTRILSASRPFAKWSPDGSFIAYTDRNCLKLIPRTAGEPHTILCSDPSVVPSFLATAVGSLGWAPDGQKIAWVVNNGAERRIEVWIIDIASGQHATWQGEKDYASWPMHPAWSPNPTQLAFRMEYKPQFEVWSFENVLPKD